VSTERRQATILDRDRHGRHQELITPEGVPLTLRVASIADRMVAFMVDGFIIHVILLGLAILTMMSMMVEMVALLLVASFLVRNFYFMWFEQRWQGRTPGKRGRQLRVVDARGGQLTVESIIVRNLTREVEVFVPLTVLMVPGAVWPGAPGWGWVVASAWLVSFALMPLFNRQRRRVGDLVAGTMVIRAPQRRLLSDIADKVVNAPAQPEEESLHFTDAQLSKYGIYELQVLEEVLRHPGAYGARAAIRQIRIKIQDRIGWTGPSVGDTVFLRAFYAAQRAHLERKMLLGKRREDKFDGVD